MIEVEAIQSLGDEIARTFHPKQIILFGSYAHGTPNAESDVDLLVVMEHSGKAVRQAARILTALRPDFPVDIVVRTPDQLQERLELNDFFLRDIVSKGKVLYASDHS